jgi:hypothetical protein
MSSALESRRIEQPTAEMIESQLALLVKHPTLRSSRRLVSFLEYVVHQKLAGSADQLKERTIGVEVFSRDPDYDTSSDHIVRTAASELRKRLAVYYRDDSHRNQLLIEIPVGSYVPQFTIPAAHKLGEADFLPTVSSDSPAPITGAQKKKSLANWYWLAVAVFLAIVLIVLAFTARDKETSQSLFWNPLMMGTRSVLLVVGDQPQGPPIPASDRNADSPPSPQDAAPGFPSLSYGDAVATTRIATVFAAKGERVVVRQDKTTSFAELQNGPVVLIGAFSNEWSLRFSRPLRFSLAMDPDRQLIYIRDRQNPSNRSWSVIATDHEPTEATRSNGRPLVDYALISRVISSETGKPMVIIGGLYVYGTEAASTLMTDPQFENLIAALHLRRKSNVLQIVLQTNVTERIPGPPKIIAHSEE